MENGDVAFRRKLVEVRRVLERIAIEVQAAARRRFAEDENDLRGIAVIFRDGRRVLHRGRKLFIGADVVNGCHGRRADAHGRDVERAARDEVHVVLHQHRARAAADDEENQEEPRPRAARKECEALAEEPAPANEQQHGKDAERQEAPPAEIHLEELPRLARVRLQNGRDDARADERLIRRDGKDLKPRERGRKHERYAKQHLPHTPPRDAREEQAVKRHARKQKHAIEEEHGQFGILVHREVLPDDGEIVEDEEQDNPADMGLDEPLRCRKKLQKFLFQKGSLVSDDIVSRVQHDIAPAEATSYFLFFLRRDSPRRSRGPSPL